MGKPYHAPSESFCQYVFNALVQRFENDLEFYKPETSRKRKKIKPKSETVVKLLKCSNFTVSEDSSLSNNLVNGRYVEEHHNNNNISTNDYGDVNYFNGSEEIRISREHFQFEKSRETVSSSFRDYVYKKLTERLENEIKLSNKTFKSCNARNASVNNGILLMKSAKSSIQNIQKPEVIQKMKKRAAKSKSDDSYSHKEKLTESCVDPEWVLSKSGTEGWCETKRPRVLKLKLISILSDGAQHYKEIK